jgi:P2 family phage contractile tail tube protein
MAVRDIQAWNVKLLDINNNPVSGSGLVTEFSLPVLSREFDTDKRAGEAGVVSRPKFFTEMEATIKIMSTSEEFEIALLQNVAKPITLQLSASAAETTTGATVPYVVSMRGYFSEYPLGDFSDTGMECEITFLANYVSKTFGSNTVVIDPANYIWSINGVNVWQGIKDQLGL